MDRSTAARAKDVVANAYRSGLLLTPYFYDVLDGFQAGLASFRDVFIDMAAGITYARENERFQSMFHSIPLPQKVSVEVQNPDLQSEPSPPVDPKRELIVEAQTAYNSMDNVGARALFEKVRAWTSGKPRVGYRAVSAVLRAYG
jgi:hypothetical protein